MECDEDVSFDVGEDGMTKRDAMAQSVEALIDEINGNLKRLARNIRKGEFLNSDEFDDCSPSDLALSISFAADDLEELVREWEAARG